MAAASETYRFDDRPIRYFPFEGFEGFVLAMLDVDAARNQVEFIIRFEPNSHIFTHRHCAHTVILVVEGEHRIYEPDGSLKEARPCGTYRSSPGGDVHQEGGGPEGAVVYFSVRGDDDRLFDVVDENLEVTDTLRTADFKALLEEQKSA